MPAVPLSPRDAAAALATFARAGLLRPARPDHAIGMAAALAFWGIGPAGGYAAHAARDRRRAAVVDPDGVLTYGDVDRITTSLAAFLTDEVEIAPGDAVGVLCRNDRSFVLAVVALAKTGASAVLLNTGSSAAEVAAVAADEGLVALLASPDLVDKVPAGVRCCRTDSFGALAEGYGDAPLRAPAEAGTFVILTSGTTGRPKGARRATPASLEPAIALLRAIPLKAGETTVIAAPLFHAWGFLQWMVSLALGSTVVLTGTFDAAATLAAVEANHATALVAVPVMLRRLLAVEEEHDTSALRVVAVSGSALPPEVATAFMDRFGDVLYDLYGSTEVAWAAIATPEDLRAAPGTVGRPPYGTTVALLDASGSPVPAGEVGRIFVGNGLLLESYTSGAAREVRDGLMGTGDLGRLDDDGRLYVVGREDDMIVSGGENVFPQPVEDVLAALPGVADVAVVGVPDEEFGQRLRAVVVLDAGASLTEDDVRSAVRAALARHYVPRDVTFAESIPRNAAGKVVRRDL